MKRSNFDFLIVGTNFISDNFTDAVRRLDGVGISAVLSRRKETGEAFAARSGAERVFTSLDEACAAYEEGASMRYILRRRTRSTFRSRSIFSVTG